jgi:hypothetical protein
LLLTIEIGKIVIQVKLTTIMQLFDVEEYTKIVEDFTSDDYETPPEIAQKIAGLIKSTDRRILDPCAGRGAMVRYIAADRDGDRVTAIEIKRSRVADGRILAPQAEWICGNFLSLNPKDYVYQDVVITNPPFSCGMDILERSLLWLNPTNPRARLLFLLPGDYFASCERSDRFESLDCHISHRYRIRGRVDYIKEGDRIKGRQISDCVHEIKLGKIGATETVL